MFNILYKKTTINKEIRFFVYSTLFDTGFSSKIQYLLFQRKFSCFFNLTNNTKAINLNLKLSRLNFKSANNNASLTGFYYAMW